MFFTFLAIRCWSKYCLDLLKTSKEERVFEMGTDDGAECSNILREEQVMGEGSNSNNQGKSH